MIVCFFGIKQSTSSAAQNSAPQVSISHIDVIIEVERLEKILHEDNHNKRLIYIRQYNRIIKQNEWQFDPIDSLIGFGRSK